jgi:hypothetical protein
VEAGIGHRKVARARGRLERETQRNDLAALRWRSHDDHLILPDSLDLRAGRIDRATLLTRMHLDDTVALKRTRRPAGLDLRCL